MYTQCVHPNYRMYLTNCDPGSDPEEVCQPHLLYLVFSEPFYNIPLDWSLSCLPWYTPLHRSATKIARNHSTKEKTALIKKWTFSLYGHREKSFFLFFFKPTLKFRKFVLGNFQIT